MWWLIFLFFPLFSLPALLLHIILCHSAVFLAVPTPTVLPNITDCYWHFRFKSWYGPGVKVQTLKGSWRQIPLAVNDLIREHRKVWGPLGHSKAWNWTDHPSTVKLVGVLQLCSLSKIREFCHFGDIILSVWVPVSDTPGCSFNVSLGPTDLD
jgi:hypothetical protein